MRKSESEFKVWVVCWPKGTSKEWKLEPDGPRDYLPLSVETAARASVSRGRGRLRELVDSWAVFATKEHAHAWAKATDSLHDFTIKSAIVKVTR